MVDIDALLAKLQAWSDKRARHQQTVDAYNRYDQEEKAKDAQWGRDYLDLKNQYRSIPPELLALQTTPTVTQPDPIIRQKRRLSPQQTAIDQLADEQLDGYQSIQCAEDLNPQRTLDGEVPQLADLDDANHRRYSELWETAAKWHYNPAWTFPADRLPEDQSKIIDGYEEDLNRYIAWKKGRRYVS